MLHRDYFGYYQDPNFLNGQTIKISLGLFPDAESAIETAQSKKGNPPYDNITKTARLLKIVDNQNRGISINE